MVPRLSIARSLPRVRDRLGVCHVIHSLGPGGAESLLVDLATAAGAAGLELSVVSLMPSATLAYHRRLAQLGVPVRSLELPTRWDPRGLPRGLAAIERLAPDIVHTHLKHADLVGAFAVRRLGVPMVSTLHLIEDAVSPLGWGKRRLATQARLTTAARTIAVSDALRRWYLDTFAAQAHRVVTLHNGVRAAPVPASARERLRRELGVPETSLMAAMVGIMRPGKGHADLIAAAAGLPTSLDIRIVLAGDGPLRSTLEATARSAGLSPGRLVFAGFREDVPVLLAASDLVVQPSRFDALPTALIHGLAAGLPAVASAAGGIPEIVTDDVGILVPPADPAALTSALVVLAGDPERRARLGAAARRRFEAEFDATVWAGRLRGLYEEALADHLTPQPGRAFHKPP